MLRIEELLSIEIDNKHMIGWYVITFLIVVFIMRMHSRLNKEVFYALVMP